MTLGISPMSDEDVDFALRLTDLEGWGYTRDDFRRFMRMDPEGALVARDASHPVGVAVATTYGKVAWMGSIIVRPDDRGKGYGKALLEAAVEYCLGQGVETCWLNAYTHVEPFYRELGFRGEGTTIHFEGVARGRYEREVRLVHARELEAIASFDFPYFGAFRLKVLREFYHEFGHNFFTWPSEKVVAYIVGLPFPGGVEVAPWACDPASPAVAERLLLHLLAQHEGSRCSANVPGENSEALRVVKSLGLQESFRVTRMFYGKGAHGIDPRGIYSLGGLEKG